MNVIDRACLVIDKEISAIEKAKKALDLNFERLVETILSMSGRVIVSGMGKSGHVANKIAATLSSTGTPAFFLHPAEGMHGDLGMVTKDDLVILITNSGETAELVSLIPSLKKIGSRLCLFSSRLDSTLAKYCEFKVFAGASSEACPLGLAPTSSSTTALVIGDALAGCLIEKRNFKADDYAIFHPGGILGRKLLCLVKDVMTTMPNCPHVSMGSKVSDALFQMTRHCIGACNIIDTAGHLVGILTDGDIRRAVEQKKDVFDMSVSTIMCKSPLSILEDETLSVAINVMETKREKPVSLLSVVDSTGRSTGIVTLTQIMRTR
jgi:arabinose-5-phosphate isomerase